MITQASFAGWAVTGGTSMTMARVLAAVESRLLAEQQAEGDTGSLAEWIGLDEPVRSVRGPGQGNHSNGNAVDINYNTAPYIATRSGATYGGEKSTLPEAGVRAMRERAVQSCDNAVAFGDWGTTRADLSVRQNDTIAQTYDRFRVVSDALIYYFAGSFRGNSDRSIGRRSPMFRTCRTVIRRSPRSAPTNWRQIPPRRSQCCRRCWTILIGRLCTPPGPGWQSSSIGRRCAISNWSGRRCCSAVPVNRYAPPATRRVDSCPSAGNSSWP